VSNPDGFRVMPEYQYNAPTTAGKVNTPYTRVISKEMHTLVTLRK